MKKRLFGFLDQIRETRPFEKNRAKIKKWPLIFLDILFRVLRIKPLLRFLKKYKPFVIVFVTALIFALLEWVKTFSIEEIIAYKKSLLYLAKDRPLSSSVAFFFAYLFIAALSAPGTTFLNIIGGFLFGWTKGVVLSLFAITIGSCISFVLVRIFLRDFFMKKGGDKIKKIYEALQKDEVYYLFALRMLPFTPLFFTNILMGLGSMSFSVFYMVSFAALFPIVAIYANMGARLSHLENLQGLSRP